MAAPTSLVPTFDTLGFVGLERSHLRSAVYRRVFGDETGPLRIGRYSLLDRVGSGARGVVFKAFDNQLDRLVALKVLSTRTDDHAELIREAKALARLSHPNVLAVYDVGETEEGQVFLATEYVKGGTLRSWFDEEHRSEAAVVEVMRQIAAGVQKAHDEGLVHRDLKPANILLGDDGRVRVADFGLARFDPSAVEPDTVGGRDSVLTTTAGTPGYMAPELFRGEPASAASDQYALAVTLRELLSEGPTKRGRGAIASALRRGLAEAPEDRFASVADFAAALTPRRARRSRRRTVALAVGLVALGGAGTAALVLPGGVDGPDPHTALLRAEAALPDDPRAALDVLAPIAGWDDDRVLESAERALMLGPEDASFELPEGSRDMTLLGSLLFYRDATDSLVARRLGDHPSAVELSTVGLTDTKNDEFTIVRQGSVPFASFAVDQGPALYSTDPWAFRTLDELRDDLSLSGDGRVLARVLAAGSSILVTDARSGETLWSLHPDKPVDFVRMDATGSRLAWGDSGGRAEIRDLTTDVPLPLDTAAADVLFEPDEDHIIVRGRESGVFRTRLSDGQTVHLAPSGEGFGSVQLSPDGTWLAARSHAETITVQRLRETVSQQIRGEDFAFSPDSTQLLVRGADEVTVLELRTWDAQVFSGNGQPAQASFGADGAVWSQWSDGRVRRHRPRHPRPLDGHEASPTAIALSNDGTIAVSTGRDYTLRRWNVDAGTNRVLAELEWELRRVALDEDGGRVAVPKNEDLTYIFDLDSGEQLGTAPNTASGPVLGPGGAFVGAGTDGVWSHDGHTTRFIDTDLDLCGALTASADIVATVCGPSDSRTLHVWNGTRHDTAPMPVVHWGETLEVWPDATHLLFLGRHDRLVSISEDGIQVESVERELPVDEGFSTATAMSKGHDLLLRTRHGLHLAWPHGDELVDIATVESWGAQAISGDGRRIAYSDDAELRVVERELSSTHRDLESVLDAHAPVKGEL